MGKWHRDFQEIKRYRDNLLEMIRDAVKIYENGAVTYMSEGEEDFQRGVFGKMQDRLELSDNENRSE